jgi:hypothetical protein
MVLLGKLVMVATMMLALRDTALLFSYNVFLLSVGVGLLVFLGHFLCLRVSPEVESRPILLWALWCNLVGNVFQVCSQCSFGGSLLRLCGLSLKWLSFVLFMMFMVGLARWLRRDDLFWMVAWHRGLLVMGFVLAVLGGPLTFLFGGLGRFFFLSPFGVSLILGGLLVYIGLIARLALAIGSQAARS